MSMFPNTNCCNWEENLSRVLSGTVFLDFRYLAFLSIVGDLLLACFFGGFSGNLQCSIVRRTLALELWVLILIPVLTLTRGLMLKAYRSSFMALWQNFVCFSSIYGASFWIDMWLVGSKRNVTWMLIVIGCKDSSSSWPDLGVFVNAGKCSDTKQSPYVLLSRTLILTEENVSGITSSWKA